MDGADWCLKFGLHVVDSFFREKPDVRVVVFHWDVGFSWRGSAEWLGFRLEDLDVTVSFQTETDIFSFLTGSILATQAHKVAIPANSVVLLTMKMLCL
jgi:predicted TIM-barrel fold metal-dependent hydrolase